MALTNWVGLITAVQEFTGRSDMSTAKVDYFIDLTENWLNNNIRAHDMETTNGSLTYSNGAITNPTDLLQWKRLSVTSNGSTRLLQPVTQEQNEMLDDGTTGMPTRYIVRGSQTLLRPTPDSSQYTISGTYYGKVPALSDTQSTNWVITNYSDVYLYGTLAMSAAFVADDPRIPLWKQLFQEATNGLKKSDWGKGFGQMPVMSTEYPVY